jgi:hypothetical protein
VTSTEPEIAEPADAARVLGRALVWVATTIAILLEDSLATDRKARQRRRKEAQNEKPGGTAGNGGDKPADKPSDKKPD